jgi:DNA-binding transcriptional MocR family regulator
MCQRGQSLRSLDTMARDWNWNRSKVRRFLKKLESESMIRYENETVTIRITICNYDTYQSQSAQGETNLKRKRNEFETNLNTNNNDNNENKNVSVEKNCEEQQRKLIFKANKGYFNECDFNRMWSQFCWVCEQNGVAFSETRWNTYTKNK